MRQRRLSIGCSDWMRIVKTIGPTAAGVLVYIRTLMRDMGSSVLKATDLELSIATHLDIETTQAALRAILDAELLHASREPDGMVTYISTEEAAAMAERFRKRMQKLKRKAPEIPKHTLFDHGNSATDGNSGQPAEIASAPEQNEYTTDVLMIYDANAAGNSSYTLFDKTERTMKKEKAPHTLQKEESHTEIQTHTRSNKTCEQPELPADSLEAEYIDIVGSWPPSLRNAIRAEKDDVREAFYLYVRQRREEEGSRWTGDRIRIAWLAARRIPAERRAESILAAAMGGWKTIRDVGSGCYFEKSTGRIVSLVRGVIDEKQKRGGAITAETMRFVNRFREE